MSALMHSVRASTAAALMVVVVALSVLVPLLDSGRDPDALAFTEPGQSTGYVQHHHGVCVQHSAAAWTAAVGADLPTEHLVRAADTPCRVVVDPTPPTLSSHRSRAPPLV